MYTEDHRSYDLGQDPNTFVGEDIWDAAAAAGKRIGLFGPMQSWPAKTFPAGGFHIPDTFARRSDTVPATLSRFQEFNLAMTSENGFSSDSELSIKKMAAVGADLVRRGLTVDSTLKVLAHLVRERKDSRQKAARPMIQVLPSFDLFWKLHRDTRPDLSVFFTNHVAGMMHRYWGDLMADYDSTYSKDPVFSEFVMSAMDLFDHQLARMIAFVEKDPETIMVIASSMGQGPVPYEEIEDTYVLDDSSLLTEALGFGDAEDKLAMYPKAALEFRREADVLFAAKRLSEVRAEFGPFFDDVRTSGSVLTFAINFTGALSRGVLPSEVTIVTDSGTENRGISELGISIKRRLGGGNTAYHIPEGIFLAKGAGIQPTEDRTEVDVLDVAPYILRLLDVEPPRSMQGSFAGMEEFLPARV